MSELTLPIGFNLKEYRIDRVLGKGNFGVTYQGYDTNLQTAVAIKEFFPSEFVTRDPRSGSVLLKSEEYSELYKWGRQRFIAEAQVLAQFRHPNILRVSRFFPANHTAYIVMDFEEGQSLSESLRSTKDAIPEARLRSTFIPLLEGLRIVHEKKYLHRDIKPANIQIRHDGSPVLIDFGAAELEFGSSSSDDVQILTPGYAPIEQHCPDLPQGPWSDLYAVGATMYRCIHVGPPVDAAQRQRAADEKRPDPMVPATVLGKDHYSEEYLQIIDWLLNLRSEDRPQSVSEVLARLRGEVKVTKKAANAFSYVPKKAARNFKIVFTGPVGAGKTTAITALSDIPLINTDARARDMTKSRKGSTTVAMDYGLMRLSESERVHLYGTPGQERFDFMWDILQTGALGLILLIDNSRKEPLKDLDFYLNAFQSLIKRTRVVIGVNFVNNTRQPDIDDYHRHLRSVVRDYPLNPPIFEIDARQRSDVSLLVQALLFSIDPGVKDYHV
ncbi:MAG: protein kinase [Gammaproteobacteria bacterium]